MAKKNRNKAPKKKKTMSIKELDAIAELYGSHFTKATLMQNFLIYSIIVSAFAYILYARVSIVLIYVVLIDLYVYRNIIPNNVKINHEMSAHAERNRAINMMSQSLSSGHTSVKNAIQMAIKNANGEFKTDLKSLYAQVLGDSSFDSTHKAFQILKMKYANDVYFGMFIEQLEVGLNKSDPDIRTIRILCASHNQEFTNLKKFSAAKSLAMHRLLKLLALSLVICLVVSFGFGYHKFLTMYAYSIPGMCISTLYMFILFMIVRKFMRMYQDISINSI